MSKQNYTNEYIWRYIYTVVTYVSLFVIAHDMRYRMCRGAARITEARLGQDHTIIDLRHWRSGFELYTAHTISSPDSKVLAI